jgi:hypothetical protein
MQYYGELHHAELSVCNFSLQYYGELHHAELSVCNFSLQYYGELHHEGAESGHQGEDIHMYSAQVTRYLFAYCLLLEQREKKK